MIMIFSSARIEGLEGTYVVAGMATEIDVAHATVAYTDNERIRAMARKLNVEVRDFPKHPPTGEEATSPKPLKDKPKGATLDGSKGTVVKGDKPETEVFEPLALITPDVTEDSIDGKIDKLDAFSSIEADINAGMTTKDLKAKWNMTGKEVGATRRKLKAK